MKTRFLSLCICLVMIMSLPVVEVCAEGYDYLDLSGTEYAELNLTNDPANNKFNITQLVVKGMKDGEVIETLDASSLTYKSSNPLVAKVSSTGLVTAKSEGITAITVSDGTLSASMILQVSNSVYRVRYDWNVWLSEDYSCGEETAEIVRTGTHSLGVFNGDNSKSMLYCKEGSGANRNKNVVITYWFYDDMKTTDFKGSGPFVTDYSNTYGNRIRIGLKKVIISTILKRETE